ncbi:basic secretory protein-like protein [Sphingobacterium corticibacterium]|uniref:Secretory protein n=1 Tax=Sphingobacterium corticibacterium TaxID=2484746 RepID=A0A4Q6XF20_9SPHI|nr:basic secretory protein-like protein [Sphingobacterium corticibacterium]RZF58460.1 secretory protein [Sphingobacterium corticibacterium]HLT87447.1 basic secretory protein-like protein [Sphingobacterium sp.]
MLRIAKRIGWTLVFISANVGGLYAQSNWRNTDDDRKKAVAVDTIRQKGFTLIWINKDENFGPKLTKKLIDVHFMNYPKLVEKFNIDARKEITFVIDPDYDGIAATSGGIVRYNPAWFVKNPNDIDIVTHEVMHIVQAYPSGSGPGWLVEGIADYVREVYGVDNAAASWSLPDLKADQHYTNSYRIAARFLLWIEKNKRNGIVEKLDAALRNKSYTEELWAEYTTMSLDELWDTYAQTAISE